ncbi:MAG: membrane-bound lytic murein transglycosylase MltF [Gammaproteobacteria bacterium]|jgi:membrane-bound lytic murein transglycosylase F
MRNKPSLAVALVGLAVFCLLSACSANRTQLEKIRDRGELRVVTRVGPTTYYIDSDGETGMEYEMARLFAQELGVNLKIIIARNTSEIINELKLGKADLAAAALSKYFIRDDSLAFGPSYQWVTPQLVYRNGQRRPASLVDIYPNQIHITDGTISKARLAELKQKYPSLTWNIHKKMSNAELLKMVEDGRIAYTVVYSNELQQARLINPELRAAFNLSQPRPLAWALRRSKDHSLLDAVQQFQEKIADDGDLAELLEYFYGDTDSFDYIDARKFVDRINQRLPEYLDLFKKAANTYDLDWRLLAAVSYQESHWNRRARSPTGVRGLMMLTLITAHRVDVKNRLTPEESVEGGAKYLRELINRIPERIPEPDRTWLALAAYNVGLGHLEDARILTEQRGGDPDKWEDVKKTLPLLSRKTWYKQTKHGYARGMEPVRYVENIRKYYKVLIQLNQPEIKPQKSGVQQVLISTPPAL